MKIISPNQFFNASIFMVVLYAMINLYLLDKSQTRHDVLETRIHQLEQIKIPCTKPKELIDAAYRF